MVSATPQVERDANYWWLRLVYSVRSGSLVDAADAQEQLAQLGVHVRIERYEGLMRPTREPEATTHA